MFRLGWKMVLARKMRLLAISIVVLIGVGFLSSTYILTDTINKTFNELFATVYDGTDAWVRAESELSAGDGQELRGRVDEKHVATIEGIPGVAGAEGIVSGYAQVIDKKGKPIGNPARGTPTFGSNWTNYANPFNIVEGRPPVADDEMVVDQLTAERGKFNVGDVAPVLFQSPSRQFKIVGIARFGRAKTVAGASYLLFTKKVVQQDVGRPGTFDGIAVVAEEGVTEEQLKFRLDNKLPNDVEVLTGTEITEENQSNIKEGLGFFTTFLQTFAWIALFVSMFVIYNIFSVVVAQRTRELAVLRALGASRRQVTRLLRREALAVGILASVFGLGFGIALSYGLKELFALLGAELPPTGIVVKSGTVWIAFIVGVSTTVASALLPGRRAGRVAPIAAMREVAVDRSVTSRLRMVAGTIMAIASAAMMAWGLSGGSSGLLTIGIALGMSFVTLVVLSPAVSALLSLLLGAPIARMGVTGALSRDNAMRNPRRTGSTALSLTIGVAIVTFILVFIASAKATVGQVLDDSFKGDFMIESRSFGAGGLPPQLARDLAALPEVEDVAALRFNSAKVFDEVEYISGSDFSVYNRVLDLDVTQERLADFPTDGVAVSDDVAESKNLDIGDPVVFEFVETGRRTLHVSAIYKDDEVAGSDYILSLPAYEANFADQFDGLILITIGDDVKPEAAEKAISRIAERYPNGTLNDQAGFKESLNSDFNQLLILVVIMLVLAIVIALIGIATTLVLAIFERRRELGLLRAVGETRGQMMLMVLGESSIVALIGTILGVTFGVLGSWAIATALESEGFERFVIPVGQIVLVVLLALAFGLLAGLWPARKAAGLNVLQAIATE